MKTTTTKKIQRVTSKGQITLPVAWRNAHKTDTVLVEAKNGVLTISPAHLSTEEQEYTVFDALRDNDGKGIRATDLVKILKKLNKAT